MEQPEKQTAVKKYLDPSDPLYNAYETCCWYGASKAAARLTDEILRLRYELSQR